MATAKIAPRITGHGMTKRGERCFTVESRTDDHWYIVVVHEHSLECQCRGSQCRGSQYYGRCAHRQAVHDRLVEERQAQREAEAKAAERNVAKRDAAPMYRDNRSFSMWK